MIRKSEVWSKNKLDFERAREKNRTLWNEEKNIRALSWRERDGRRSLTYTSIVSKEQFISLRIYKDVTLVQDTRVETLACGHEIVQNRHSHDLKIWVEVFFALTRCWRESMLLGAFSALIVKEHSLGSYFGFLWLFKINLNLSFLRLCSWMTQFG